MTKPKLLDQMRNVIRLHQYSHDTERAYLHWVKRFILFHHCRESQFLAINMLYGSGVRLMECLRFRIGDIDFTRHTVRVNDLYTCG